MDYQQYHVSQALKTDIWQVIGKKGRRKEGERRKGGGKIMPDNTDVIIL